MDCSLSTCSLPLNGSNETQGGCFRDAAVVRKQVRDGERRKAGLGPKCHFFNSFFVNKLWQDAGSYCYASVARWTHQKKLQKQGQVGSKLL